MNTQNYTLEKHLEAICREDSDYNVLLAAWRLNKENLALALSTISSSFPHYSRHDATHSSKILDNIQRLLGQDRIERLGATDTFLILMAAMTHDLGMYLYYGMLEEKWKEDKMEALLKNYSQSDDKTIAQAARLLLNFNRCTDDPAQSYLWALEIKNAVTLIIAHQMRGGHEKRSAQYIEDDDFIAKLTHGFHFELLPSRYLTLLSKVAYLHGTDFDEVTKILKQNADGYKGDYIHPRFIACMIRMGDLLDIDSNRFNDFASSMIKEVPESSKAHFDKHQAVKHLLISPSGIEAELDCKTDASYRVARQVFDWLEKEVEKLSRNWSLIAPDNLGGLPPVLHTDSINILYNGTRTRTELMNLRFDISSKKTFEMLKGGAIYENPGRVFLLEIVQNDMDATKLQIWQDMDIHLPFDLENPKRHIGSREDICFFGDIPASVYNKYPVSLDVDYNKEDQSIIVTCEDCGTGISDESLIRMTSQVGASRKADKDYEKTIKAMPYFLQPTAAFGLGLQTVFYVTDEFTVETRCPGEKARRIVFRTSTNGSYCSIVDENIEFQRTVAGTDQKRDVPHGTTVKIVIDKEHLDRLFELDEKKYKELINDPASIGYHIPASIDDFARKTFTSIDDIPFRYHSPYNSFETHNSFEKDEEEYEFLNKDKDKEEVFRLYGRFDKKRNRYRFWLEERKYGSHIKIEFDGYGSTEIMLRNIPVTKENWWWNKYAGIEWNMCCREADQQVNLSRDGLLPQGASWCKETMNELLPVCIQLTHQFLLERCQSSEGKVKDLLLEQYAKLCLLNWHLLQPIKKVDLAPIREHLVKVDENHCAIDNHGDPINTKQVIDSERFVLVTLPWKQNLKETIINNSSKFQDDELIISERDVSIPDTYICSEIFFVQAQNNNNCTCYRLIKENQSDGSQLVTISNDDIIHYIDIENLFINLNPDLILNRCIHAFKNYEEIVVDKDAPLLGFDPPFHGKCWIYPIKNIFVIKYGLPYNRTKAETFLREKGRMEDLVPDHIVELIQKYNVLKNENLSKEEIHNAYIRLILDSRFGVEKPSEQKK